MADLMAGLPVPHRPVATPRKPARRKRKSDSNHAEPTRDHTTGRDGDDAKAHSSSDDWWEEIIHHHLTLLHSHARLLGALLKTTPAPSAARRGAVAGFLEGTRTMLGQVRAVQESNAGQTADAVAAVAVPVAGGRKRRKSERVERKRKRDSGELRSPGASDGEGEAREGGTGGRKVRKVDAPGEKVEENGGEAPMITPVGGERAGVETEDITAEVEARLKAKERARARLKEGGTKRRRRSSTVEVDERRREKRVRRARESLGEAVFEGAR